jgi:hypothetical protein
MSRSQRIKRIGKTSYPSLLKVYQQYINRNHIQRPAWKQVMSTARSKRPQGQTLCSKVTRIVLLALQALSACVVAGIMFFFIGHLREQSYTIPWMFFMVSRSRTSHIIPLVATNDPDQQLQGAAITTLLTIVLLSLWKWFRGPSPILSCCLQAFFFVVWTIGFGLLANAMQGTITRPCTTAYWGNDEGVRVCDLYKILFGGAAVGV